MQSLQYNALQRTSIKYMYTTTKCDKTSVASTHYKTVKSYQTVYSLENISHISKTK